MNTQKKRIFVYSLFIVCGFLGAYLFLRNKNTPSQNTQSSSVETKDSTVSASLSSAFFDLEDNGEVYISSEKFFSGKKSCKLSPAIEYGISINKTINSIPSFNTLKNISIKFKCLVGEENPDALFVLSINDAQGKNVFWDGKSIVCDKKNEWSDVIVDFIITPEFLNSEYNIVAYPWNRNKKTFYIDDISIDYIGSVIYQNVPTQGSEKTNLFFDFETVAGMSDSDNVIETKAHSGKKAYDLSGGKEYGPSVNKKFSEIGVLFPKKTSLSIWVYPLTDNPNTVLTVSVVNSKNETVFWEGKSTENENFPKNKWTKINASCFLPIEKISPDDILGIGIWNKGKTDVLVDDLEIVYGEASERRGSAPKIDATAIYEKRFVGEKNKPPFKTIYFEKQELNNENTNSITPPDKVTNIDDFSPNDSYLVGDFFSDKNNLEEIICIKDVTAGLFSYSPENKQFKKLWENTSSTDSQWNNNNKAYSGDFNTDGKTDVLLVDKRNNNWKIINFNGKEWLVLLKGNTPKKEWLAKKELAKTGIIQANDIVFPGNYFDKKQTFLKLNTDWRFDLKLLEQDGAEYTILGNVDFKGYPKDYNPKYYEFVKIVQGKFISKDQTSILVVMCNCADKNFDGQHCKKIEDLSFLPNSTQVYTIMK